MSREAQDFWDRAVKTFQTAKSLQSSDPNSSASRAYYAAFYAVSALFALKDRTFSKHSALETAIHRDLIKTGVWDEELGKIFSSLRELRSIGDYGGSRHVTEEDAGKAVNAAHTIIEAVQENKPDLFTL